MERGGFDEAIKALGCQRGPGEVAVEGGANYLIYKIDTEDLSFVLSKLQALKTQFPLLVIIGRVPLAC